jgi:hypothetical protein
MPEPAAGLWGRRARSPVFHLLTRRVGSRWATACGLVNAVQRALPLERVADYGVHCRACLRAFDAGETQTEEENRD